MKHKTKKYLKNLFRKKSKLPSTYEVNKMARRNRVKRVYFKAKKYHSRKSSGMGGLVGTVLGAGVYGALRSKLAQAVDPITQKLPFGNIADEVALGGLAVILKKTMGKRMPMLNPVLNGAIAIESARIGEAIATGSFMGGSQNINSYVYG